MRKLMVFSLLFSVGISSSAQSAVTVSYVQNLRAQILVEHSKAVKEKIEYFFGPLSNTCLAKDASHAVRESYLRSAAQIFLAPRTSPSYSAGFFFNPGDSFFFQLSPNEVGKFIPGLHRVLLTEWLASNNSHDRSDKILGWYGMGWALLAKAAGGQAQDKQNWRQFVGELDMAIQQSIEFERTGRKSGVMRSVLGEDTRIEMPRTVQMRINILDLFSHRWEDTRPWDDNAHGAAEVAANAGAAHVADALRIGLYSILEVQGDARLSRLASEMLLHGPGYTGKGLTEYRYVFEALPLISQPYSGNDVIWCDTDAYAQEWLSTRDLVLSWSKMPEARAAQLLRTLNAGASPAMRYTVKKFSDPEAEESVMHRGHADVI